MTVLLRLLTSVSTTRLPPPKSLNYSHSLLQPFRFRFRQLLHNSSFPFTFPLHNNHSHHQHNRHFTTTLLRQEKKKKDKDDDEDNNTNNNNKPFERQPPPSKQPERLSDDNHHSTKEQEPPPSPPPSSSSPSDWRRRNSRDPQIPGDFSKVLVIPMSRRPLFPKLLKHIVVKDPNLYAAIRELLERQQPYVGVFLLKDGQQDVDVIESMEQVYNVGSFAQIMSTFPMSDNTHIVVLNPVRRIEMKRLIKPDPEEPEAVAQVENGETVAEPIEPETEAKEESTVSVSMEGKGSVTELPSTDSSTQVLVPIAKKHSVTVAEVENVVTEPYQKNDEIIKAISNEMLTVFKEIAHLQPFFKEQIASFSLSAGSDNVFEEPDMLADFAAAISSGEGEELQGVLQSSNVQDRLEKSLLILKKELHNVKIQHKVSKDVESKITKRQKEYYLMEQLKGIKKELGLESDGKETLVQTFKEKAESLKMPEAVKQVFNEEISKLGNLEPSGSEFNVTRNYLDWLTQIPWGMRSAENYSIEHAQKILDEDHHGLKDVKDRILEFIAVGNLRGTVEGNILCLVGPPGVGKTSIGKSIARALERQFYRFSVGGLTDVAEIKGHRRTYVGSMPGKVIQALKKVKTENPLILIDEIDKLGRGHQGDPASALLELLDPEQNSSFLDHYMDVPVDLSQVLFVCTANVLDTIPGPLLDRMEVIHLSGYIADEKIAIATKYLAPAAKKASGLDHANVTLHTDAVEMLIRNYCRESGVRNLKKHIDKVYRKSALRIVQDERVASIPENVEAVRENERLVASSETSPLKSAESLTPVPNPESPTAVEAAGAVASAIPKANKPEGESAEESESSTTVVVPKSSEGVQRRRMTIPESVAIDIRAENLKDFVGPPVFSSDRLYETTPPGVVMGLAWTRMGGSALYVESCLESTLRDPSAKETKGGGPSLTKTGQLGDVMKESTAIAYTYAKSLMVRRFPENLFFDRAAIHLHVPEGATPKDGPSAGITMTTSLLSLALSRPVSPTVAMTGELTLTGKVLKIGGLREKVIAAKRSGVTTLIFPGANRADWEELPENIREELAGLPVEWYEDVYRIVFDEKEEKGGDATA